MIVGVSEPRGVAFGADMTARPRQQSRRTVLWMKSLLREDPEARDTDIVGVGQLGSSLSTDSGTYISECQLIRVGTSCRRTMLRVEHRLHDRGHVDRTGNDV